MNKTKKIAISGLLGALALVLAYLEGLLPPLPMMPPGAKPGMSNIVTMFAAGSIGLPYAVIVALIKGGFALMTRGAVAGTMSLCGGLLSTFAAWALFKKTNVSFIATGMICALCHNFAQLMVAMVLTGQAIIYYIPALVFFGVCSGFLTGLLLKLVYVRLGKMKIQI